MKRLFSMMLLCAAVVLASCSKDDPATIDVTGVTLDKTTASIVIGTTQTLVATVAPDNVEDKSVTWTSSDATVATVANGVVTAVKEGATTITATSVANPTKKATCAVTVTKAVVAVAFSGLTANGSATETTTALTLTFDKVIEGLAATDITLTVGETETTKGELTAKPNGVYELAVSGITKGGEITVAVAKTGYTITPASKTVTVILKTPTITWAAGNLVADGANGAKIGAKTDGGLFFQFGSLVGWSTTGSPTIAVKPGNLMPANETWAATGKIWQGTTSTVPFTVKDSGTDNEKAGVGDPCRYYLGGTWRLPTTGEYEELFKDHGYPSTGPWKWDADSKSATHTDGLTFPASGSRGSYDGSLSNVGTYGCFWGASPIDVNFGYLLYFTSSFVNPSNNNYRASGFSVRCVQEK